MENYTIIKCAVDADTSHESAADIYDSLGWMTSWEAYAGADATTPCDSGDVQHPVWSLDDVEIDCDSNGCELVNSTSSEYDEEQAAYWRAMRYAQSAASWARQVEAALASAVEAYRAGDAALCAIALDNASALEREYGDDPGTRALRSRLLEEAA